MGFENRLKELRMSKGMKQSEMAAALNYSRRAVIAWERGDKLPTFDAIIAIAKLFNVSADYLLGLKEG